MYRAVAVYTRRSTDRWDPTTKGENKNSTQEEQRNTVQYADTLTTVLPPTRRPNAAGAPHEPHRHRQQAQTAGTDRHRQAQTGPGNDAQVHTPHHTTRDIAQHTTHSTEHDRVSERYISQWRLKRKVGGGAGGSSLLRRGMRRRRRWSIGQRETG